LIGWIAGKKKNLIEPIEVIMQTV